MTTAPKDSALATDSDAVVIGCDALLALFLKGDAAEALCELPTGSVDCVIIDPPFSGNNSKAKEGSNGRFQDSLIMYDDLSERAFYKMIKPVFLECFRVMKEGAHFYCFSDWRQLRNMMDCVELGSLKIVNQICWDKISFGMGSGYRRQEEYIIVASKGHPKAFNLKNVGSVIRCKRVTNGDREHPHEKPQDLLRTLIENSTKPGEKVLDCFMGSGSTAEACKVTGRGFVGVELDAEHYETAKNRTSQILC